MRRESTFARTILESTKGIDVLAQVLRKNLRGPLCNAPASLHNWAKFNGPPIVSLSPGIDELINLR